LLAWLSAPDAQADEPQAITQSLRDEFACPGMQAEWLDEKTVQCLKKGPDKYHGLPSGIFLSA
jgi:hypothetical protein